MPSKGRPTKELDPKETGHVCVDDCFLKSTCRQSFQHVCGRVLMKGLH